MQVRELVRQLQMFEPELDVLCYTEDPALLSAGHGFRLLDIESVQESEGKKTRTGDGNPSMGFGHGSPKHVLIQVTSDF